MSDATRLVHGFLRDAVFLRMRALELGQSIAVDGAGRAYVTGYTQYTDFPTTAGAARTAYAAGFFDASVTKLDATGSGLVYSTYLGGSMAEFGFGIALDGASSAYVTGMAVSTAFVMTDLQTSVTGTASSRVSTAGFERFMMWEHVSVSSI